MPVQTVVRRSTATPEALDSVAAVCPVDGTTAP